MDRSKRENLISTYPTHSTKLPAGLLLRLRNISQMHVIFDQDVSESRF